MDKFNSLSLSLSLSLNLSLSLSLSLSQKGASIKGTLSNVMNTPLPVYILVDKMKGSNQKMQCNANHHAW